MATWILNVLTAVQLVDLQKYFKGFQREFGMQCVWSSDTGCHISSHIDWQVTERRGGDLWPMGYLAAVDMAAVTMSHRARLFACWRKWNRQSLAENCLLKSLKSLPSLTRLHLFPAAGSDLRFCRKITDFVPLQNKTFLICVLQAMAGYSSNFSPVTAA